MVTHLMRNGAVFLSAVCFLACGPAATEDECRQMCENLENLRGKIDTSSEQDLLKRVEEKFASEKKRLEDWKARDLKGWDEELAAKIAALESNEEITDKEAEKKKLTEEYEKKKEATAKQHDPGIEALGPEKVKAIEEAKQKAVSNKAQWDETIKECIATALKEKTPQKLAQCRTQATTTDQYWNICK